MKSVCKKIQFSRLVDDARPAVHGLHLADCMLVSSVLILGSHMLVPEAGLNPVLAIWLSFWTAVAVAETGVLVAAAANFGPGVDLFKFHRVNVEHGRQRAIVSGQDVDHGVTTTLRVFVVLAGVGASGCSKPLKNHISNASWDLGFEAIVHRLVEVAYHEHMTTVAVIDITKIRSAL